MKVSQREFVSRMLDPEAPVPDGLKDAAGDSAGKRFDVYRNNVAVSLTDALATGFPVIHKLVGEDFFRAVAGVYLRAFPPKSPLMMHYGDDMPDFLAGFPPAASLPYLPDIARLELGLRHSYHAADAIAIAPDALANVAPDALATIHFRFAPAVKFISSDFPIHAIYRANTQTDAPKPVMQPEAVLITRPAFDPDFHILDPAAAVCAHHLLQGAPLGDATAQSPDALNLGALLGLLLAQGAVTEIY